MPCTILLVSTGDIKLLMKAVLNRIEGRRWKMEKTSSWPLLGIKKLTHHIGQECTLHTRSSRRGFVAPLQ